MQKGKVNSYRYRKSLIKNVPASESPLMEFVQIQNQQLTEGTLDHPEQLLKLREDNQNTYWVKIIGKVNQATLDVLNKAFIIDKSLLENILDRVNKPKAENFEDFHLMTLKSILDVQGEGDTIKFNSLCLYLEKNFVVSFSEAPDKLYADALLKIKTNLEKKKETNSAYIYHRIIDCVFDEFYELTGRMSALIDLLNLTSAMQEKNFIPHLYQIRKNVMIVKREMFPMKEALVNLMNSDQKDIDSTTKRNFRYTYENAKELYESMEHFKDLIDNFSNLYTATINSSTNRVFKELTIFTAIFAPLTFIAGIYGMNFRHMPELNWHYGYLAVWIVFAIVTLFTVRYFKKKHWI